MENSNSQDRFTKEWYDFFGKERYQYYGVFIAMPNKTIWYKALNWDYDSIFLTEQNKDKHIVIDPHRYKEIFGLSESQEKVMLLSDNKLFRPKYKDKMEYNINFILEKIHELKKEWEEHKPFINRFLANIKSIEKTISDDDLYREGIIKAEESKQRMDWVNACSFNAAAYKKNKLRPSLYDQYFQQMASHIHSYLFQLLHRNKKEINKFDKETLIAFAGTKKGDVKDLDGFSEFEKMRLIWNHLKHNSAKSFKELTDNEEGKGFPEVLIDKDQEFDPNKLACYTIKINEELIDSILKGIETFCIKYCELCFEESIEEAKWNYELDFFFEVQNIMHSDKMDSSLDLIDYIIN